MKGVPVSFIVWISISLVCFIFYVYQVNRFLARLREQHRSVWQDLGSPQLLGNNNIINGLLLTKFIALRQYKEIDDPELRAIGNIIFVMFWAAVCASVVTWYFGGFKFKRYYLN